MKLFLLLLLLSSCAKLSYIVEQGVGQVSLEIDDIDNEDFLASPKYSDKSKEKVKIIIKAKDYFYNYFSLTPTEIYDEVKILDNEAVTYLVIHSPSNEIKAISTSFPIVGSFPYLGFFDFESAKEYKKNLEDEGFHTFLRNVYAYSTLNHPLLPMDDNILSSFFHFNEEQLVELIFHELVHTIIFIKDNVAFNENLAQFIAREMMKDYLNINYDSKERIERKRKMQEIRKFISQKAKELNQKYQQGKNESVILQNFLADNFIPEAKKLCSNLSISKCSFVDGEWNNARFAAFGTYEEKQDEILALYQKKNYSLKEFVNKLRQLHDEFDYSGDFLTYVKRSI